MSASDDAERISVKSCEVVVDHLVQQRKNLRARKNCRILLERDDWGNILFVIVSASKREKFRLEDNIIQVYTANQNMGKASLELQVPRVMIMISKAENVQDLKQIFEIMRQLKDEPETANSLELWRGDKEDENEESHEST